MGKILRAPVDFMKKILIQIILLVPVLFFNPACLAEYDVSSVSFRGDSTLMGMKIERSYCPEGNFIVETTGGIFEYADCLLKIYQGLDRDKRRLLASISLKGQPRFEKIEATDDHILFWSEQVNIGIYGDSTCILAPKSSLELNCKGNFKPDYEGRFKGELLLIDEGGGMEIYPQRYEAGYELKKLELGREDWIADYILKADERVMIAAFPGRPFDWERSFKTRILITHGSTGLGVDNVYGQMPPDRTIKQWSENFDILVLFFRGLYKRPNHDLNALWSHSPYIIENEPELQRLVNTAHINGLKVATYCSLFSYYRKTRDIESFYAQIKALHEKFDIDGVYVDGLAFDFDTSKDDNKILNWDIIRQLRLLFGKNGVLILHDTQNGTSVSTVPSIDSYCDATINGEGVSFHSLDDPYIKYQVRKYGISNTVGIWRADGKHPESITYKNIIDTLLLMNGRLEAHAWVPVYEPPSNNKYRWGNGMDKKYMYYLEKLSKLINAYKNREISQSK